MLRITEKEQADENGEDNGDQLQPEMRHVTRADEAQALQDAADDESSQPRKTTTAADVMTGYMIARVPATTRSTPSIKYQSE